MLEGNFKRSLVTKTDMNTMDSCDSKVGLCLSQEQCVMGGHDVKMENIVTKTSL